MKMKLSSLTLHDKSRLKGTRVEIKCPSLARACIELVRGGFDRRRLCTKVSKGDEILHGEYVLLAQRSKREGRRECTGLRVLAFGFKFAHAVSPLNKK